MEAQKNMLSADTLAAIHWLGMPEGTPFPLVASNPPSCPETQPEPAADDPDAWREAFHQWRTWQCVSKDRCFGGIGSMHIHFCEWTVQSSTVAPCTRATFEGLLSDAGFLLADGFVSGLILAEDWHAAHSRPERRKPAVSGRSARAERAISNPTRSPNPAPYTHVSAPVREMSVKGEPNCAG